MFTLFVILTIFCAVLLIGIVLIQKSKGGGLSSAFAGSNQVMGVRRTNDFIEKMTWYLAAAIAVFSILSTYTMPDYNETQRRMTKNSVPPINKTDFSSSAPTTANTPAISGPESAGTATPDATPVVTSPADQQ